MEKMEKSDKKEEKQFQILKNPEQNSISIHQAYFFFSKQQKSDEQEKGKGREEKSKLYSFLNYTEICLGARKNISLTKLQSKTNLQKLLDIVFPYVEEMSGKKVQKKRMKCSQLICQLQNKIWDLDLIELDKIKKLIPEYDRLYNMTPNTNKTQFEEIVTSYSKNMNASNN